MAGTEEQIELGQLKKEEDNKDVIEHVVIVVEDKGSLGGDIAGRASELAINAENRKRMNENGADLVVIQNQGNDTNSSDNCQDKASGIEASTEAINREGTGIFCSNIKGNHLS